MAIEGDFSRAVHDFGATVHAVGQDQWSNQTPCTEWDVRALVNHLVNEALWVRPLLGGMTVAQVGDRFDGDLLGGDPAGAWERSAEDAVGAASAEGATERTVHVSSGDISAGEYLHEVFTDLVIHRWDLARAIGADDTIDPVYAATIYERMKPMEDQMKSWGAYGDRIEVRDGADTQTRLLALFGRVQ
jgi:uncharacterized protein (TIGR03086 family)